MPLWKVFIIGGAFRHQAQPAAGFEALQQGIEHCGGGAEVLEDFGAGNEVVMLL